MEQRGTQINFDRTARESLDDNVEVVIRISSVIESSKISSASLVILVAPRAFWKYQRAASLFPRTLWPLSMTLGRRLRSMYLEVFEILEEDALQPSYFAIVRATRVLAWVLPKLADQRKTPPSSSDHDVGLVWSGRCGGQRIIRGRTGMVCENPVSFRVVLGAMRGKAEILILVNMVHGSSR